MNVRGRVWERGQGYGEGPGINLRAGPRCQWNERTLREVHIEGFALKQCPQNRHASKIKKGIKCNLLAPEGGDAPGGSSCKSSRTGRGIWYVAETSMTKAMFSEELRVAACIRKRTLMLQICQSRIRSTSESFLKPQLTAANSMPQHSLSSSETSLTSIGNHATIASRVVRRCPSTWRTTTPARLGLSHQHPMPYAWTW